MLDGLPPTTLFSVTEVAPGCRKFTVSLGVRLKLFQLIEAVWVVCVMLSVLPAGAFTVTAPDVTLAPVGSACASNGLVASMAATRRLMRTGARQVRISEILRLILSTMRMAAWRRCLCSGWLAGDPGTACAVGEVALLACLVFFISRELRLDTRRLAPGSHQFGCFANLLKPRPHRRAAHSEILGQRGPDP